MKGLNQFVNNVVYNWGNGGAYIMGDTEQTSEADIRNNYFIVGATFNYDGKTLGATAPFTRYNEHFRAHLSVSNGLVPDFISPGPCVGRSISVRIIPPFLPNEVNSSTR